MQRSLHGTIGAALLCCVALAVRSQTEQPEPPTTSTTSASTYAISKSLGLLVYPAKGHSSDQQSLDEQQCYDWPKTQTGIDPFKKTMDTCLQGLRNTTG